MKSYFIQYPLFYTCNLRCPYCFNERWRGIGKCPDYEWSIEQYKKWRDKCLEPDANIVIHLASGEPSFGRNINAVERIFGETDREKFDILTNGTYHVPDIWIKNRERIDRIGATFHRKILTGSQGLVFYANVMKMRDAGLPVYVKELAFRSTMHETLRAKEEWEKQGIQFKIQHYRQVDCEFDEDGNLDEEVVRIIDPEYLSYDYDSDRCYCRKGFEGIILRFDGRIIACWHNQKVVGSIQDGTYQEGSVTYKYIAQDGKTKCRVCLNGEAFDHSLGQTIGELFRINRREQGMNKAAGSTKAISVETFLFSARKRLEDAVGIVGNIVSELEEVIVSQDARIRELNQAEKIDEKAVLPALAKSEGIPGQRQG